MLWQAQQRPEAAVITANLTVMNKIEVNIEMVSIKMSKIETNSFVTNKISDHLVNQIVDSFSSVLVSSDVTRFVISDRLKIEILTRKPVQGNVSRLFFIIYESDLSFL